MTIYYNVEQAGFIWKKIMNLITNDIIEVQIERTLNLRSWNKIFKRKQKNLLHIYFVKDFVKVQSNSF